MFYYEFIYKADNRGEAEIGHELVHSPMATTVRAGASPWPGVTCSLKICHMCGRDPRT